MLVDGMAVLYRAFFAIRELSTSSGRPTNALFGFIRMLRQMMTAWHPSHVAVAFDGGLPEERTALLAEYKAQRPPLPEPLRAQIDASREYLDRAGITWLRVEGQEADDIIASLARWAEHEGDAVLIASSDKDLYQLVGGKVRVVPVSGELGTGMGPDEVKLKTGVSPAKIVEWLALVGDSADNIPGVPGVGPKTAAKLLNEFGSLEDIWCRMDAVESDRIRASLLANRPLVDRNIAMMRLRTDLVSGVTWDALRARTPDKDKLLAFYEEMEFGSLARELREPALFDA